MKLLTVEEVAELLRMSPHALHQMRYRSTAPPALKIGRRLLFDSEKLNAWLMEREVSGSR